MLGKKKIKENNFNYTRFLMAIFVVFVFLFSAKTTFAGSTLRGAAWWGEDLEYLYFDCEDYESGSHLDALNNFSDEPEPLGFKFFIGGCVINHRVKIDNNGIFSGAAYNFKKGMVNFGGPDNVVSVPDYSFASNCLVPSLCTQETNCSACYNERTQRIYGYAQVKGGAKELIRLDSYQGMENALQLKSWNMASSTVPFYGDGINPGDFMGHASATIDGKRAPLSFNCLSEKGIPGNDNCAQREPKKVFIGNPEIAQMSAPNWSYESACAPGRARAAALKWQLRGGSYQGYEVLVTKTDELPDIINISEDRVVCHSGFKEGAPNQYIIPNSLDDKCKTNSNLNYEESYYWFVRLYSVEKNSEGNDVYFPTVWYQFGDDKHHQAIFDVNNGPYKPGASEEEKRRTFTTYKHEFPVPYFTWSPLEIEVGTTTIFNALSPHPAKRSGYFNSSNPSAIRDCVGQECLYIWNTNFSSAEIGVNNSYISTTTIIFHEQGNTNVSLTIRDRDGYQCTKNISVGKINYGLPIWREVKAE